MTENLICNNILNKDKNDISEDFDINNLNIIREKIESMTKFNQIEVLRILNKHKNIIINENKYGIHINLSEVNNEIIDELKVYIDYVNTQEINLNEVEKQKEEFKNIYFGKDIKEN
jgi:hypothetical protein